MAGKGSNPNSKEALRRSVAKRKKNAKRVNLTLSPEAIKGLDRLATDLAVTRSGLIERYGCSCRHTLNLTDTAWEAIATAAKAKGLSESGFVEQWAQKLDGAIHLAQSHRTLMNHVNLLIKCDRQESI